MALGRSAQPQGSRNTADAPSSAAHPPLSPVWIQPPTLTWDPALPLYTPVTSSQTPPCSPSPDSLSLCSSGVPCCIIFSPVFITCSGSFAVVFPAVVHAMHTQSMFAE